MQASETKKNEDRDPGLSPEAMKEIINLLGKEWQQELLKKLRRGPENLYYCRGNASLDMDGEEASITIGGSLGDAKMDSLVEDLQKQGFVSRDDDGTLTGLGPYASIPPQPPKENKQSGKNTMNEEILRAALLAAASEYNHRMRKPLLVVASGYKNFLEDYPDTYRIAEEIACQRAASYYIWESGLDRIKTRSSTIIAKLRKMGWLPPKYSKLEHRVEFFTSLGKRVEQGRTWDYAPL